MGSLFYKGLKAQRIVFEASSDDVFARPDVAPIMAVLRLLANPNDSLAFRTVASATRPALPPPLLDTLAVQAAREGTSMMALARRAHAASNPLAAGMASSSQPPSSQASSPCPLLTVYVSQ